MSNTKHTSGPWNYEGGNDASIDIILPNDTTIAIDRQSRFTSEYVISRAEMEANAKLIAAAPELLEFIERLVSACELDSRLHREAKALIKKATE